MPAALSAGQDPRYASPGVLGFLVVFLLALATWLLIRSMVGHLRKVRYSAEAAEREEAQREAAVAESAAGSAAAESAAAPARSPKPKGGSAARGKRPGGRR